jgi:electron transport complex protein RnfA
MNNTSLWSIFINAALINNFVLAYFLGICPFLGVSGKLSTASRMGLAVSAVMVITSVCAYGLHALLTLVNAPYMQLISYIVVIATMVQIVEMAIKKSSPVLFRNLGIFLPLITTNCAILALALFQTNRDYNLIQCLFFAVGAGAGFTLALILMAGLREKLSFASVPDIARGTAVTLMLAGILSLTFMGFAGLGS